jgi:hypothetical protein
LKKIFSIFLLVVFLFNVGGYYLVFVALRFQATAELTQRLDADEYSQDELIELRLPVSLPYPLQENGFQRVDGKFEHKGQFYRLVKQKLENDVLIIICIKDKKEKQLDESMKDYSKLANDVPSSSKKTQNILSKLLKDFESLESGTIQRSNNCLQTISFAVVNCRITGQFLTITGPPPKA